MQQTVTLCALAADTRDQPEALLTDAAIAERRVDGSVLDDRLIVAAERADSLGLHRIDIDPMLRKVLHQILVQLAGTVFVD